MIKVISEISTTKEKCIAQIKTRVIIEDDKELCEKCRNQIIKSELKSLISVFVEKQPELLFNALEEVITEGLSND